MKRLSIILILMCLFQTSQLFSQDKPAYVIYTSNGKKTTFEKLVESTENKELVLFGEFHDNPISHWLQMELTKEMYEEVGPHLQLGFEMFEQDQQELLSQYLLGNLTAKQFKDTMRLWPNYETDYAPLIDFAKKNKLFCVASNVQRKYASLLFKKGRKALDTLSLTIKSQMAPIDFIVDTTLSQYKEVYTMGGHMGVNMGMNMLESQAFKDATMAQFIMSNPGRKDGTVHLHFNGAFHSDFHQGILWYVQQKQANIRVLTISTVTQEDVRKLDKEHLGRADFIICVPESMTRTH
ncbi:MAG: ChaN family lipoprotein [Crocinitomicaceae bacterium]|nr:ChaN family lipoprotein [Crocinitomicaceae bacterium]MBP6033588.1 ChaN family lipoprotein [Crocinitomicaceae bacterium]